MGFLGIILSDGTKLEAMIPIGSNMSSVVWGNCLEDAERLRNMHYNEIVRINYKEKKLDGHIKVGELLKLEESGGLVGLGRDYVSKVGRPQIFLCSSFDEALRKVCDDEL